MKYLYSSTKNLVGIRGIEPRSKPYESSVINHYTISPLVADELHPTSSSIRWHRRYYC